MSTVLGQLYQLSLRGFLDLRLRVQRLLRDHVAAQLADARDQLVADDPNAGRRRGSRSRSRPAPPRQTARRHVGRRRASSRSPAASPTPSSISGADSGMSTSCHETSSNVFDAAAGVPGAVEHAPDSPRPQGE